METEQVIPEAGGAARVGGTLMLSSRTWDTAKKEL